MIFSEIWDLLTTRANTSYASIVAAQKAPAASHATGQERATASAPTLYVPAAQSAYLGTILAGKYQHALQAGLGRVSGASQLVKAGLDRLAELADSLTREWHVGSRGDKFEQT